MCDLSPKAECVPAFGSEGKLGPFVRKVKKWDEKRLGQRCDGNFLAIFAETVLSVKPNFTGRFFER